MKEDERDEGVEPEATAWEVDAEGRPYIELATPVERKNAADVERLTFYGLKVRDMRILDKIEGKVSQGIALVAKAARVPTSVVDEIEALEFAKAQEIVAGFFGVTLGDDEEE